jgi:hypothetical protein
MRTKRSAVKPNGRGIALAMGMLALLVTGCTRPDTPQTPADAYRQRLAALADYCKRRPSLGLAH